MQYRRRRQLRRDEAEMSDLAVDTIDVEPLSDLGARRKWWRGSKKREEKKARDEKAVRKDRQEEKEDGEKELQRQRDKCSALQSIIRQRRDREKKLMGASSEEAAAGPGEAMELLSKEERKVKRESVLMSDVEAKEAASE